MQIKSIFLKNVSVSAYSLPELAQNNVPYSLAAGVEIDLLDEALPGHYIDPSAALRAITEYTGTELYKGVHSSPAKLTYRVVRGE